MDPDLAPLIGSWGMLRCEGTFVDTGERFELFGPKPEGLMVFTSGGRIMFLIAKSNRQAPTDDVERAVSFNDMAAYTGLVRADGPGRFITTVDLAWNPAWTGEQFRYYTISGDRLEIRTPQQTHSLFPDRLAVGELEWEREQLA
jgi:hypothetical protein